MQRIVGVALALAAVSGVHNGLDVTHRVVALAQVVARRVLSRSPESLAPSALQAAVPVAWFHVAQNVTVRVNAPLKIGREHMSRIVSYASKPRDAPHYVTIFRNVVQPG